MRHLEGNPPADAPRPDGVSWQLEFTGSTPGSVWQWLHYDLVSPEARRRIENDKDLADFARQALVSTDETQRVVTDGECVAGVLPTYARTGDADAYDIASWHFVMTPDRLITGRRRATRTLFNVWNAVQHGQDPDDPASLLDLCVAEFAREVRARLALLANTLDPIEDRLIEARPGADLSDIGGQLGNARREAVRTKRTLSPVWRAFDEDAEDLPEWARFEDHHNGVRLLHSALDDVAALHDRARSLQDELTTRLAEETNRRLYIVSVVTTLVMPGTFITGFFGMNTGGLLWGGEESAHGTLYAGLLCLAAILGTLLTLRLKRLL